MSCDRCGTSLWKGADGQWIKPEKHHWYTRLRDNGTVKVFCGGCFTEGAPKDADARYLRELRMRIDAVLLECEPVGGHT